MFAHPFGIAVMITLGVAFLALVQGFQYTPNLVVLGKLIGLFAILGAFLGIIYATDPRENIDFKVKNRPAVRTILSSSVGGVFSYMFHLSPLSAMTFVLVFGILGWLGMRWAKYVDF
jgi:hypothetical protein